MMRYVPISFDWIPHKLVRIETLGEGSCLFHAVLNAFFIPYRYETLNDKKITKREITKQFRNKLSDLLPEHYDNLNKGTTKEFSLIDEQYKLENMQHKLKSNESLGYGYFEFLSIILNKDIYILDVVTSNLYFTNEYELSIKGNRNSIIISYIYNPKNEDSVGHYELIGRLDENEIITHFSFDDDLIKLLNFRHNSAITK